MAILASRDLTGDWAKVDPSLFALCFKGLATSPESGCKHCQILDHGSDQCPTARKANKPPPPTINNVRTYGRPKFPRIPVSRQGPDDPPVCSNSTVTMATATGDQGATIGMYACRAKRTTQGRSTLQKRLEDLRKVEEEPGG